jgi:ABC-2 type transport system permease protein
MVNIEANKRLGTILQQLNYAVLVKYWLSHSLSKKVALSKVLPIRLNVHPVGNPQYSYGDFVITGLLILILQQLLLIGVAESIALEKEAGTIKNWFKTARQSIGRMIVGKGMIYLSFYFVYFLFVLAVVLPVFHIEAHGKWIGVIIISFFFFVTTFSMGVFFGSLFTKKIQALQVLSVTSVPIFLMTGYSWPFYMLPTVIKFLSYLLPTYWMLMPFQNVIRIGAPIGSQWSYLLVLIVQSLLYSAVAYWRIKKLVGQK